MAVGLAPCMPVLAICDVFRLLVGGLKKDFSVCEGIAALYGLLPLCWLTSWPMFTICPYAALVGLKTCPLCRPFEKGDLLWERTLELTP